MVHTNHLNLCEQIENSKCILCDRKTGFDGYLRVFYIQKILGLKINNRLKDLILKTDLFIGDALFKRRTFSNLLYQGNYTIKTN